VTLAIVLAAVLFISLLPLLVLDTASIPSLYLSKVNGGSNSHVRNSGSGSGSNGGRGVSGASSTSTTTHGRPAPRPAPKHTQPQCHCPDASAAELQQVLARANSTVFVETSKPRRSFHSNHW